jgi:hypothetical protein
MLRKQSFFVHAYLRLWLTRVGKEHCPLRHKVYHTSLTSMNVRQVANGANLIVAEPITAYIYCPAGLAQLVLIQMHKKELLHTCLEYISSLGNPHLDASD